MSGFVFRCLHYYSRRGGSNLLCEQIRLHSTLRADSFGTFYRGADGCAMCTCTSGLPSCVHLSETQRKLHPTVAQIMIHVHTCSQVP